MNKFCLFLFSIFFPTWLLAQPIELVFWHGMAGHLQDEVRLLAEEFNKSQNDYIVRPVYKGDYVETFTNFAAAFRANQPPNIVQIFEVGTDLMLAPKGVIKPVDEVMAEQNMVLPKEDFIQSSKEFYSRNGHLMAMPFNLSAPVIYYNQEALAKVGYTQSNFPKTWAEMDVMAKKLSVAGAECVYTSAYPGWVLFESYLAIHGLPLMAGNPVGAAYNTPKLQRHFKRLKRWQQHHYFRYAGRADEASVLFTSGVCPLFSQSSGAYNSLNSLVPFKLGVAVMPLDTEASVVRYPNVTGGAALWVVSGQTPQQYRGIAQFFAYLARPETQKQWHEHTGYLPIGLDGIYAPILLSSTHPALGLAKIDLQGHVGAKSTTRHMGPQNQIRAVNDEVLEAMFSGAMSPIEALDESVRRANHIMFRFVRNTQIDR